jgi:hypothetical protein
MAMKVHGLLKELQEFPGHDATAVIADELNPNAGLIVTGIVERGMARSKDNPDFAEPGLEPAVEFV